MRVTNPERFQPLHDAALRIIQRLQAEFDVERVEGYGLDEELERVPVPAARPTIKLAPVGADAAPLTFAFTEFPGIRVRAGHWMVESFPGCGCDACDEDADVEITRLTELVEYVTAGRFIESVELSRAEGCGWVQWELWLNRGRHQKHRSRIELSEAPRYIRENQGAFFGWGPWPPKKTH